MKRKVVNKLLMAAGVASLLAMPSSNALADDAAAIFTMPSGTTGVTYDGGSSGSPVITAILSQPGTVNGKTYSSWSFLANDGSGSLVLFGSMPNSYVPTVGDAITASGEFYSYHQIPELENLTDISATSSGNAVAAIGVSSIPTLNQATLPQNVAGYLWELDDVTISGISGTFDVSNLTGTITDSSNNSMTLYYWPTSYSSANANLYGTAIPTGPVNMTGFVSVYSGTAEFTPISVVAVPEPASLALFGIGGLLSLTLARRRS